jgi:hypothetical protein
MNIRPLVIDDALRERFLQIREKATRSPITVARLAQLTSGFNRGASLSIFADTTIDLPFGYRVTFTVEHQPTTVCRHLSISVSDPGKLPGIAAVEMLMKEFGFINPLNRCLMWLEEFDPGHQAVNLMEPISGDMTELQRRKDAIQ